MTVTMMPDLAQKARISRIVGVQVPFGHSFGTPHNDAMMLEISRAALHALEDAGEPGYRLDVDIPYPVDDAIAYKTWHPPEPSPIVARMLQARAQQPQPRA